MDSNYCYKECEKGQMVAHKIIWNCESAFDASLDFSWFIKDCFETCPYKEFHKKEIRNDEF